MTRLVLIVAAAAGLGAAFTALAGEEKGLVCTFSTGTSGSYEKGTFKVETPKPISFEIAGINLDGQSAALVAPEGGAGAKLAIARAVGANHFLEIAAEGYWNITTVYDTDPASGTHPAVHSRHLGVVGQPLFAQYTGTCRGKE